MKKELLIAGVIGLVLGLFLVGGYFITKSLSPKTLPELINPLVEDYVFSTNSTIKFSNTQNHQLTITNPIDQALTTQNRITIIGQTTPQSTVVLLGELGEAIALVNKEGNFEQEIGLVNGENQISLTAFSPSGIAVEKLITIVVSTYEF